MECVPALAVLAVTADALVDTDTVAAAFKTVPPQLLVLTRASASTLDAATLWLFVRDAQIIAATVFAVSSHFFVLTDSAPIALDTPAPLPIMVAPAWPPCTLCSLALGSCSLLFARTRGQRRRD